VRTAIRPLRDGRRRVVARTAPIASAAPEPYRTFYSSTEVADLIEAWREEQPDQVSSSYFQTHVGRFTYLTELIKKLGLTGRCLDVGGTSRSMLLLTDRTSLDVALGPECDLEIDDWAETAGLDAFDVVVFSEVIEHFNANPSHCLHEINRVLHDGGWLLLTTVNVGSELGVYNLLNGEAPYAMSNLYGARGDRHQREYAPKELQRLVAAHGFETWATTVNVYNAAEVHRQAHRWLYGGGANLKPELHGDTNMIVARKVRDSEKPRWLHPVYHSVVAENQRGHVPADVAELLRQGAPAPLAGFYGWPAE
jgi:SAM-dependent methyltransferase